MDGIELISFQIISAVGTAKSCYVEAITEAEKGNFEAAEQKIKEGEEIFVQGHSAHASLIQKEASGEGVAPTLLLLHAEDQLMSAETIKIMAEHIIKLCKRVDALAK